MKTSGDLEDMTIDDLLRFMVKQEASDLHLKPMRPPLVRIGGRLLPLKTDPLHPDLIRDMIGSLLNDRMRRNLEENFAVDFGHSVSGVSRFRASVFYQRGTLSAVFRRVPFDFPSLEDWGLPQVIAEFASAPQGLVLITGPTGSGKSSTLAGLMRLVPRYLFAQGVDLCWGCHDKNKFLGTVGHPPVAKGECLSCHDVHTTDYKSLIPLPMTEFRFKCHENADFVKKSKHPRVAEGKCRDAMMPTKVK